MMGYRVGSMCYLTEVEAVDAFFSSLPPTIDAVNPISYMRFSKVSGVWNVDYYHISNVGVWSLVFTSAVPVKTLPTCIETNDATSQFNDGMLLGWGVVLAMVIAWGFKIMTPDGWRIRT